jgi:hypothetical protein
LQATLIACTIIPMCESYNLFVLLCNSLPTLSADICQNKKTFSIEMVRSWKQQKVFLDLKTFAGKKNNGRP